MSCLAESASLSEVSLDGNPFAQDGAYKQTILRHMQQLHQLDMRKVTVSTNNGETINTCVKHVIIGSAKCSRKSSSLLAKNNYVGRRKANCQRYSTKGGRKTPRKQQDTNYEGRKYRFTCVCMFYAKY